MKKSQQGQPKNALSVVTPITARSCFLKMWYGITLELMAEWFVWIFAHTTGYVRFLTCERVSFHSAR